jgi:hypothetical protein
MQETTTPQKVTRKLSNRARDVYRFDELGLGDYFDVPRIRESALRSAASNFHRRQKEVGGEIRVSVKVVDSNMIRVKRIE